MNRPSRQHLLLRLVVAGSPLVALAGLAAAGAGLPWWILLLVVALAVSSAALPEAHTGLALVLAVGGYWGVAAPDDLSPWLLLVALALLVFHVTCLLASYGPPSVVLERALLQRWLLRTAGAAVVTVLVWVVARVLAGLDPAGGPLPVAAALLVAVGWAILLGRRLNAPPD